MSFIVPAGLQFSNPHPVATTGASSGAIGAAAGGGNGRGNNGQPHQPPHSPVDPADGGAAAAALRPVRLSAAERAAVRPEPLLRLSPQIGATLERYLSETVPQLLQRHESHTADLAIVEAYLDNRNPIHPPRLGVSNFNTPHMLWHRNAAVNRLERAVFGQDKPIEVRPTGRKRDDAARIGQLNRLGSFLTHAMLNTRMLNAREVIADVACDMTDAGTGAWAVVVEPDELTRVPESNSGDSNSGGGGGDNGNGNGDSNGAAAATRGRLADGSIRPLRASSLVSAIRFGGVTWQYVPFRDLIYWDGYGTEYNAMPFAGYRALKTWQQLRMWAAQRFYYPAQVAAVANSYMHPHQLPGMTATSAMFDAGMPDLAAHLRPHPVGVIHIAWDVTGDGVTSEIRVDFHLEALRVLGVYASKFDGRRPLVGAQYSPPARRRSHRGQSVAQQTIQAQAEANVLHNFTIEAGKRGGAHMTVVRRDSGIDEELGDGDVPFVPGDIYATEDVEGDVKHVPLGDARAGQFLVLLEERLQVQMSRLTGFGDPSFGNVASGKRVPASLGLSIMSQGNSSNDRAIVSISKAIQEAFYLTIVAWRERIPERALRAVLEPDDVDALVAAVFNVEPGADVRDDIAITIKAADTANNADAKRQALLLITQFILTYYDKVTVLIGTTVGAAVQFAAQAPQAADAIVKIQTMIFDKMQHSVAALVKMTDELGDPQDTLIELEELHAELNKIVVAFQGGGGDGAGGGGAGGGGAGVGVGVGVAGGAGAGAAGATTEDGAPDVGAGVA